MFRLIKTKTSILTILDAPVEDAAFERFYDPYFRDEETWDKNHFPEVFIATREG